MIEPWRNLGCGQEMEEIEVGLWSVVFGKINGVGAGGHGRSGKGSVNEEVRRGAVV